METNNISNKTQEQTSMKKQASLTKISFIYFLYSAVIAWLIKILIVIVLSFVWIFIISILKNGESFKDLFPVLLSLQVYSTLLISGIVSLYFGCKLGITYMRKNYNISDTKKIVKTSLIFFVLANTLLTLGVPASEPVLSVINIIIGGALFFVFTKKYIK